MSNFTLEEINVFPIKSLGGIRQTIATMTDRGLELDRRWMVVDHDGNFLTQRQYPGMALLHVSVHSDGLVVQDTASPADSINIPWQTPAPTERQVVVWKSRCTAWIYGREINDWFSRKLDTPCQLAFMPDRSRRPIEEAFNPGGTELVSFADGFPTMIIGESSLADLNSRLEAPVGMDRFRTNLVFRGGSPFVEDSWKQIRIGEVNFRVVKPCARCVMTTVDPKTAVTGREPLRTLATYRRPSPDQGVMFGQNLMHENLGKLAVGQVIEVVERAAVAG